jgi:hypothetical protein
MKGKEVLEQIREQNHDGGYAFIGWWRREEDWLDYDLLERFVANASPDEEIDGFSLHTLEEMWERLVQVAGGRVARVGGDGAGGRIVWDRKGEHREYPFTAAAVMEIFDEETEGNVFP